VDAMERFAAGQADARNEIREGLTGLVALYPAHIEKEDRHFFKPAMAHFSPEEQATMLAAFREFDRSLIHERYRSLVERLEAIGR
jgi:hemerythrin-like domain-containing protein